MHIAYRKKYQTGGDWSVGDSRGVPYNDTVNVSVKNRNNDKISTKILIMWYNVTGEITL